MTEVNFFQSWAFTFIVGVVCFAAGFALAIIIAGGGKGSKMEEKMMGHNPPPKKSRRPNKPTPSPPPRKPLRIEILTQGKPEDN